MDAPLKPFVFKCGYVSPQRQNERDVFESHLSSGPSLVQRWLRLAIASLVVLCRERASSLHSTLCSQVSLVLSTLHFYKRAAPAEYRIHANGGVHKSLPPPHLSTSTTWSPHYRQQPWTAQLL